MGFTPHTFQEVVLIFLCLCLNVTYIYLRWWNSQQFNSFNIFNLDLFSVVSCDLLCEFPLVISIKSVTCVLVCEYKFPACNVIDITQSNLDQGGLRVDTYMPGKGISSIFLGPGTGLTVRVRVLGYHYAKWASLAGYLPSAGQPEWYPWPGYYIVPELMEWGPKPPEASWCN